MSLTFPTVGASVGVIVPLAGGRVPYGDIDGIGPTVKFPLFGGVGAVVRTGAVVTVGRGAVVGTTGVG